MFSFPSPKGKRPKDKGMTKPENHKWLFLDLNSFFASVEQNENPNLRGKPVAVIPSQTDHTCAIAASYEAKAYGVKTGTIIRDAKKMCPNLICVPARHDIYVQYHNRIIEEIIKHAPINKIWSIDELSSRLPPAKRNEHDATKIANNLRHGLWNSIGPSIGCSVGVAPNSLLAKIASNMQKPNGLAFLPLETLEDKLATLELTDITGVGKNMEARLNRAGITTMRELWNISPKHARKIWGSVQGERMWYWLHGHDFEPPPVERNYMIGHSRILDPDLRSPEKARLMARRLLTKATYRLRRKEYFASTLSLGVTTVHGQKWRREIKLSNPAQDPFTFLNHLELLWHKMVHDFHAADIRPLKFKKVSTLLMNLHHAQEITGDMMVEGYQEELGALQKRESLANALDTLQKKYEKETVTLGTPPKTLAGYVGTKIAFSRVPDTEEFWN